MRIKAKTVRQMVSELASKKVSHSWLVLCGKFCLVHKPIQA